MTETIDRLSVRRGVYQDSVTLMRASTDARAEEGVVQVAAVAGTPLNLELLSDEGFAVPHDGIGPNDLVIAIRAVTDAAAGAALAALEAALLPADPGAATLSPAEANVSLSSLARLDPELNVGLISIPGDFLAYEVAATLESGINVFCFSAGLTLAQERRLKERALERGLLLMGPDCGTSVINGIGLGFANEVRRGPVGLVGASGTGMQEAMCLLDRVPLGISNALGVGGRDLSAEVGGLMTERALSLLDDDDATEVILLISKPPDRQVADRIVRVCRQLRTPIIPAFLGEGDPQPGDADADPALAGSLEEAASLAAQVLGRELPPDEEPPLAPTPGHIRGLFCGGSLCYEAMTLVSAAVGPVASNTPLRPEWGLQDVRASRGHTFVDCGEERLTRGRPHPMIDPHPRNERLSDEAADPDVGVCLLDVVLGRGAHPDPSEDLVPRIRQALGERADSLSVIVSLCGTDRDPQGLADQERALREAGAVVTRGAAQAARLALAAIGHTAAT